MVLILQFPGLDWAKLAGQLGSNFLLKLLLFSNVEVLTEFSRESCV